jgi:DNA-binding MarR family transcriptional regulator
MAGYYTVDNFGCDNSFGYLVRRTGNLILGRLEAVLAEQGVTVTQWVVLMHVRHGLARTAADISRDIGYDSGALTRVMDQLEQHGLIERRRCCHDRRAMELTLTETGRQTLIALMPAVVATFNQMLDGFSHTEVDTLIQLLTRFIARAQASPEPGP